MDLTLTPVGVVRSGLTSLSDAPMQGDEGGVDATVELGPRFRSAMDGLRVGDEVLLLTWLDRADRSTLTVHPRDDQERPLTGVFATRSAERPNPIGLHRVRVLYLGKDGLRVAPLEALDGTPVLDIKPVLRAER